MADAKQEPQTPEAPQQQSISSEALQAFTAESGMTALLLKEANVRISMLVAELTAARARVAELEKAAEREAVVEARVTGVANEILSKPKRPSKAA